MTFQKHPLLYILLPICIFAVIASFYRFMVAGDYVVEYEGACDPSTESCFVGCTDDECTEAYFYTKVQKSAGTVLSQCGPDVTDCESANVCLPGEADCSVTFCSADALAEDETCVTPGTLEEVLEEQGMEMEEGEGGIDEPVAETEL